MPVLAARFLSGRGKLDAAPHRTHRTPQGAEVGEGFGFGLGFTQHAVRSLVHLRINAKHGTELSARRDGSLSMTLSGDYWLSSGV